MQRLPGSCAACAAVAHGCQPALHPAAASVLTEKRIRALQTRCHPGLLQARKLTKTRLTAELGNPLLLLPRQIHLYTNIKELIESIEGSFEAAPAALQWSVCSLGPNHIQLPRQVPHLLAARATAASLGIQCPEQLNPASQPEGPGFELVLVHEDGGGSGHDQWVLEGRKLMVKSLIGLQQLCKTPMFRCWVCSKPALQICGKCHRVAFCSQECGQRGLQAHLQECKPPAAQAALSAGASNS